MVPLTSPLTWDWSMVTPAAKLLTLVATLLALLSLLRPPMFARKWATARPSVAIFGAWQTQVRAPGHSSSLLARSSTGSPTSSRA